VSTIDRSLCPGTQHGTDTAYNNHGCRCADAREARRLRRKRRREGRLPPLTVDPVGSVRRVQALAAIGWCARAIADAAGTSDATISRLQTGRHRGVINRGSAAKIAAAYERLSGRPGPTDRSRLIAKQHGWAPPLLWEDVDIDDPAATPIDDTPQINKRNRVHRDDLEHLRGYGLPVEVIAQRLAVKPSSIERHLERDRQQQKAAA